jgi:hypothetical protein
VEVEHEAPSACEKEMFIMLFPYLYFGLVSCFSVVSFIFLSLLVSPYTTQIYNCGRCDSFCRKAFFFVCFILSLSKQRRHIYGGVVKDHMLLSVVRKGKCCC